MQSPPCGESHTLGAPVEENRVHLAIGEISMLLCFLENGRESANVCFNKAPARLRWLHGGHTLSKAKTRDMLGLILLETGLRPT